METQKEFSKILNSDPVVISQSETLTLTTPVRPSKKPEMFEIYLGKLSSWIEVPVSVLTNVEEIGVVSDHHSNFKIVQIDIKRPKKDAFLFDLLENALIGIDDFNANEMECNCGCQSKEAAGGGMFYAAKAKRNSGGGSNSGERPVRRGTGGGTGGCCFFWAGRWWCPNCRS